MILSFVLAIVFGAIYPIPANSRLLQGDPASQAEQARAAADQAYAEAMQLYSQKTPESTRGGIAKSQEALVLYRQAGDRAKQAEVLVMLGSASLSVGDKLKAVEYLRNGLELVHSLGHRGEEGVVVGMLASAYESSRQFKSANETYQQQLALCQELNNRQCQGLALMGLGRVAFATGDRGKSLDYFAQALPIWRALGDRKSQVGAAFMAGSLNDHLNQKQAAIPLYLEALSLYRDLGDRFWEARVLMDLAQDYAAVGNQAKASSYYDQAIPALHTSGDENNEATALIGRSLLYEDRGDTEQAIADLTSARHVFHALGDGLMEATALIRLGIVRYEAGEHEKSLEAYQQALELTRPLKNPGLQAAALTGISSIYLVLGDDQSAARYSGEASTLMPTDGSSQVDPDVVYRLGVTYTSLKENDKAIELFTRAADLQTARGDQPGEARALHALAGMYDISSQPKQALTFYEQALKIREASGDRRAIAQSLTAVGTMYAVLSQHGRALDYYGKALEIYRAVHDRVGESRPLFWMAKSEEMMGDLETARRHIEAALAITEMQRSNITSEELRTTYLSTAQYAYALYVEVLMREHKLHPNQGYNAKALEAHEAAKARGLLDLLSEAKVNIRQGSDPELLQREIEVKKRLEEKQSAEIRLLTSGETGDAIEALQKELEGVRTEYQQTEAQIRGNSPRYAALTQPQPLTVDSIQKKVLDGDTVLLEYALDEPQSYVWIVSPSGLRSFELSSRIEIEKLALRLYRTITVRRPGAPDDYQAVARSLSDILLAPVAAQIANKRLVIVPDGVLQIVPFAALPSPGVEGYEPLIVRHEVVGVPSASTIALLRRDSAGRHPAPKKVAVFADPVFDKDDIRVLKNPTGNAHPAPKPSEAEATSTSGGSRAIASAFGLERLASTRQEAKAILRLAPPQSEFAALDFDAKRSAAMSPELERYQIIHFATHGIVNDVHPELSGLVLSLVDRQGDAQDGFLRLNDLFNLQLNADLVVLSACKTALGRDVRGEGLIGLARGFMYAGAPRVVTSLWSVNDQATAEEMQRFYTGMLGTKHLRPAAALRQAQIEMWKQEQWHAPFLWAAFILQGDWK